MCLTVAELKDAETAICRLAQKESFAFEFKFIRFSGILPKSEDLYKLSPDIDENNLIRVSGRIDAASWFPYEARRPDVSQSSPVGAYCCPHTRQDEAPC